MKRDINISPEEFDRIERYILADMPANEREAFTTSLENNSTLQEKVHEVQLLIIGMQESSLAAKLEEFHSGLPVQQGKASKQKIFLFKRWLLAAAVIAIIAIGTWLLVDKFNTNDRLYNQYYKPDPGLISAMSTSDNYPFDRAMIDYKTGEYEKALNAWKNLLTTKPANDTLHYFVASAYLALGKKDSAKMHFEKVMAVNNSYFLPDTYWYMGLILLQEEKKKEAASWIEKSAHENKEALLLELKK